MAQVEVHVLVASIRLTLTYRQPSLVYPVDFDHTSDVAMVKDSQKHREDRIGDYEKEAIEHEAGEVKRKGPS